MIHSRAWTRAMLDGDADASNVIPFPGGSHTGEAVLDDVTDAQELLDFMAADLDPVPADPDFRERLREELWERILAEGVGRRDERKDR